MHLEGLTANFRFIIAFFVNHNSENSNSVLFMIIVYVYKSADGCRCYIRITGYYSN